MSDESAHSDAYSIVPAGLTPRQVDAVLHQNLLARRAGGPRNRPLIFDSSRCEVRVVDHAISLPYIQFAILKLLASQPYWPFRRDEIAAGVHLPAETLTLDAVDEHVHSLRRKLGPFGDYVQSVPGFGYRFKE